MDRNDNAQSDDWVKLVDGASILGVYPGTLYRRWRYRQFPADACRKVENVLYFNRRVLESMRESVSTS